MVKPRDIAGKAEEEDEEGEWKYRDTAGKAEEEEEEEW